MQAKLNTTDQLLQANSAVARQIQRFYRKHGYVTNRKGDFLPMRGNARLPKDAWKELDSLVVETVKQRLVLLDDFKGVQTNTQDIFDFLIEWQEVTEAAGTAEQSMGGRPRTDFTDADYNLRAIPLPITYADFQLNWRRLGAGQGNAAPDIDAHLVAERTRHVAELLEYITVHGSEITLNGESAPGLITFSDAVTGSLSGDYANDITDYTKIVADHIAMRDELVNKGYPEDGPYNVYWPTKYSGILEEDYTDYKSETVRERLERITGIDEVKVAPELPHDNKDDYSTDYVSLVYMSPEVVQVDQGAAVQPIEWEAEGGFVSNWKIFGAEQPRFLSDANGNTGIVNYSD